MKRCLITFIIAVISIIPIYNVKASDNQVYINGEWVEFNEVNLSNYNWITGRGIISSNWFIFIIDKSYGDTLTNNDSIQLTNSNGVYYKYDSSTKTFTYKGVIKGDYDRIYLGYSDYLATTMEIYCSRISTGHYEAGYGVPILEKDYLSYTANKASDLNNNDIYNIRINANNYNSNYKYMIKTSQEKTWTDITSNLNNEVYQYDFIIRYNTTLYMQVLDENNTILETKTHTITDLNDYGFIISHAPATDLNDRDIDVVTIDTKFIYKENYSYQYSFDNKIFYDMSLSSDNTVYYLNHALNIPIYFRVVDNSNTVIYTQNYTVDFEELNKKVNFKEKAGTSENGSKEIVITIDFNEFLKYADMYNFKIYVDNNEYDESNNLIIIKMTNETFKRGINYKIYVDNLELFSYSYRVGVESGTGGGSDTDFDNTYDNVIENELKDELGNSDYTSISGMIKVVQNFINAISQFVTTFFELIMYFFNELNIWVRTCIIALFIELCVFKTIKAVRK